MGSRLLITKLRERTRNHNKINQKLGQEPHPDAAINGPPREDDIEETLEEEVRHWGPSLDAQFSPNSRLFQRYPKYNPGSYKQNRYGDLPEKTWGDLLYKEINSGNYHIYPKEIPAHPVPIPELHNRVIPMSYGDDLPLQESFCPNCQQLLDRFKFYDNLILIVILILFVLWGLRSPPPPNPGGN